VNTHYHVYNTGSDASFTEVKGSTIFAHDNVRKRLASKEEHTHSELPIDTAAMVSNMKSKNMSVEDLVKQGLGEKYKAWAWSFITEERWITTFYKGQ
jgi:hypothetical protein